MAKLSTISILLAAVIGTHGFSSISSSTELRRITSTQLFNLNDEDTSSVKGRRDFLSSTTASIAILLPTLLSNTLPAYASGGATAGKYTTIPIAKRRYFGRVKQGIYEYNLLGAAVRKGELSAPDVLDFFDDNIKTVSARQKAQCFGDGDNAQCKVKEKFSSRWEDLKLSMFLLGNSFRMDSGKPPEKVKQVKEAQAFFVRVEKLRKARAKGDRKA